MRLWSLLIAGICTAGLLAVHANSPAAAQEKKGKAVSTLKVGDQAPKFASVDDEGKPFKSTEVVGKQPVALFFFPAALTGG